MSGENSHSNVAFFIPHLGCPNQCSFCNQKTISGQQDPPSPSEIRQTCQEALEYLGERAEQAEIAFFGGSFTAIERGYMVSLLQAAFPFVGAGKFFGIRISTRPDAVENEVLTLLRDYGVTTIELGAQSMDDEVLRRNFRGQTAGQVADASRRIRQHGFSLGLQMMTGLDGQDSQSCLDTAARLAELKPQCVRIYPTVVLKGTLLAERFLNGTYMPPDLDETVSLGAELLDFFEEKQIPVIRFGLHSSKEIERQMLAGGYRPALRELCEARRFLSREKDALESCFPGGCRETVQIAVNPKDISKALGQKKGNLLLLEKDGWKVRFIQDGNVKAGQVKVCGGSTNGMYP